MIDFSYSEGKEFALMFGRTCNIACRHCGIESSPRNKERMLIEDAERFIIEAATISDFKKVTFTGGEPMMFPAEHDRLLRLCRDLGLSTRMVTNGFWAKSRKRGSEVLGSLKEAGLTELNFSADRFHLEFMEARTLRNALDVAREHGFPRIISYVSTAHAQPLDEFAEMYGVPRRELIDLRSIRYDVNLLEEFKDDFVFVFYGGLIGLGRALEHPELLRFVPFETFAPDNGCREIVNKPVIYPDGSFQACCCAGGKISSFTVGNAHERSVPELFEAMMANPHFRLINTHGPRTLFDCVRKARPDLKLPSTYTSICELCVRASGGLAREELETVADDFLFRETLANFVTQPSAPGPVPVEAAPL